MMWKELLLDENVIRYCVASYSSCIIPRVGLFFPQARVFCVLNDVYEYNT